MGFDKAALASEIAKLCVKAQNTFYILVLKLACCYQTGRSSPATHSVLDRREQRKSNFFTSLEFLEFKERFLIRT